MILHHLSFLLRLAAGQTAITLRRVFRGPRVVGWTVAEERLHGLIGAFVRGTVRWGFAWARSVESRAAGGSPFVRRTRWRTLELAGVPAVEVTPAAGEGGDRTVLYLHGGGYCIGSPATYREIIARLALAGHAATIAPAYRLAPEHPFPAGHDDCLAVYRALLAEGRDPGRVVVAGDSAGGALAISVLHCARDEGLALPAGVLLFSPLADPWAEGGTLESHQTTDTLDLPFVRRCFEAARIADLRDDPRARALGADLRGLPPVLIQVGALEMFVDQDRALHRRLCDAGVESELREYPLLFHTFQNLGSQVPRADIAVRDAEAWAARLLGLAGRG
ncbi:MAG TPA: alpha/beta hydrolase [Thermoanaerobaculia bacterium]|nr:alpha/beta hydrolase [Thermoanaerobaculia bacterium]